MPVRGELHNLLAGCSLRVPIAGDDLRAEIRRAAAEKFDFVALPLASPGGQGVGVDFQPSVASQLTLDAAAWQASVVGVVSEDLGRGAEAADAAAAEFGRAALETELRWAAHLSLRGVLLPAPALEGGCSYARAVNDLLLEGLFAEGAQEESPPPLALRVPADSAGWTAWNRFRTACDHHPRLAVALELGSSTTGGACNERELQRWLGEPVRFVVLHAGAFLSNRQGYPVLPRKLKAILLGLFRHQEMQIIIASPPEGPQAAAQPGTDAVTSESGAASAPGGGLASPEAMLNYVALLFRGLPKPTAYERFASTHQDTLQSPLQPLQDNLESETYELFETDPVKYRQYEEAVLAFLRDRLGEGRSPPFNVMVLGAGRGPLVAASLRAARRADAEVKVWAVEKNPNAVHALRHRKRREQDWACVEVVAEDMRAWKAPRKADALVSELLGSFGDNELSPECLDGAQHLLAEDGVCIPQSYVSSLAPVSAPALWADARGRVGGTGGGLAGGDMGQLETAYVVCLHRAFYPTAGPKDCFVYKHPKRSIDESNDRSIQLEFEAEVDTLVHGFAAYFDCTLYGDVRISIHPQTLSEGMFSWFPMFFPLQIPVYLRKGQVIRSHWWRRHDARKVWYEWMVSEPAPAPIQNPGGRSWPIGLR
uniref:Protein arginine N-methyltransferase n=1 Tax=Zooxanthella nutricula TaxID=1333877 RepID=A0A6U9GTR7_9DINO|mmetsp:Transcript_68213/g.209172  ORF Transcript_68213/g.209172 Transcript_68213/m.209172 type:complete len:653 (+) Transcript_68213:185-2143(+)